MSSLEPWSVPGCGSINLLATGEMCDGDTIHDRQHPHDLFMELAADYDRPIRGTVRWQVYAGLAGEPALGPAGFPHRTSAWMNPIAPIAHHWLDSTHITFGLVTTGVYGDRWKAEASVFNGREPDDERADLDLGALDSVSGRLSFLPTDRLALQVSAAHLREAEAEFPPTPRSDLNRLTASATYHRPLSAGGVWATTLAYGLNSGDEVIPEGRVHFVTSAILLESALTLRERHTFLGRGEIVEKPAHDLHAHEFRTEGVYDREAAGGLPAPFCGSEGTRPQHRGECCGELSSSGTLGAVTDGQRAIEPGRVPGRSAFTSRDVGHSIPCSSRTLFAMAVAVVAFSPRAVVTTAEQRRSRDGRLQDLHLRMLLQVDRPYEERGFSRAVRRHAAGRARQAEVETRRSARGTVVPHSSFRRLRLRRAHTAGRD